MSVKRKYNKANIHIDGKFVPSKKGKFIVDAEYVRDDRTDKSLLNSLEQIDETVEETNENINERIDNMFNDGKIKSDLLPSYVDDIIEGYYYNGAFYLDSEHTQEIQGESGKIYSDISVTPAVDYRWGGSAYVVHHAQADWNQSDNTAPDFIKNKPSIPDAQIQADWEQTNDTLLDFIKNKPLLIFGQLITNSSGSDSQGEYISCNGSFIRDQYVLVRIQKSTLSNISNKNNNVRLKFKDSYGSTTCSIRTYTPNHTYTYKEFLNYNEDIFLLCSYSGSSGSHTNGSLIVKEIISNNVHELAALTDLDDLITNTALIKDHTYYITGGTDVYLATSNATCIKYSGSVYPVI